jgi:hypothetical protein
MSLPNHTSNGVLFPVPNFAHPAGVQLWLWNGATSLPLAEAHAFDNVAVFALASSRGFDACRPGPLSVLKT